MKNQQDKRHKADQKTDEGGMPGDKIVKKIEFDVFHFRKQPFVETVFFAEKIVKRQVGFLGEHQNYAHKKRERQKDHKKKSQGYVNPQNGDHLILLYFAFNRYKV